MTVKTRDVDSKRAIGLAFKAFGLDPQNQDHWDTLLGTLARARPKKRRGRPPTWTPAGVAKFNKRVASLRRALLIAATYDLGDWESFADRIIAEWDRLAAADPVSNSNREIRKSDAYRRVLMDIEIVEEAYQQWVAAFRETRDAQRAGKPSRPHVFEAIIIAMVLRQEHYQCLDQDTLRRYVQRGAPTPRAAKSPEIIRP